MTLRRFPWKAPRLSDNSYRLFVSPPDPDQDKLLDAHRKSLTSGSARNSVVSVNEDGKRQAQSEPASRNPTGGTESGGDGEKHHHHHHHHNTSTDDGTKSDSVSRTPTQTDPHQPPTIKGPLRLLRLLPRESRHIIARMLELNPSKRADMDEILDDPWVQSALVCRQEEDGVIINVRES